MTSISSQIEWGLTGWGPAYSLQVPRLYLCGTGAR